MKITLNDLKSKRACKRGINYFIANFGENAVVDTDDILKKLYCEKITTGWAFWLIENFELTAIGKAWRENGRLAKQGQYVNGEQHGEWTWWYENGQLREQRRYVNGELHGEWIWGYENGQLREQGQYVNGKQHGEWIWWHENGQVARKWTGGTKMDSLENKGSMKMAS